MRDALKEQRLNQILQLIRDKGQVTVDELCAQFGLSQVTARRDLHSLADRGLVVRAHGGAVLVTPSFSELSVMQRASDNREAKDRIGRAAAALVADGESIFVGSGSTTAYVARHLAIRKNLTVVTNALNIAAEIAAAAGVTVVVTGGMLRASELSLVGHITEQSLREVRVERVILGMAALSPEAGMTNDYLPEVMTDRKIIEMAPELILVADHTKFGKMASAYVAPLQRAKIVVTDPETDSKILDQIRKLGTRIIVAQ